MGEWEELRNHCKIQPATRGQSKCFVSFLGNLRIIHLYICPKSPFPWCTIVHLESVSDALSIPVSDTSPRAFISHRCTGSTFLRFMSNTTMRFSWIKTQVQCNRVGNICLSDFHIRYTMPRAPSHCICFFTVAAPLNCIVIILYIIFFTDP